MSNFNYILPLTSGANQDGQKFSVGETGRASGEEPFARAIFRRKGEECRHARDQSTRRATSVESLCFRQRSCYVRHAFSPGELSTCPNAVGLMAIETGPKVAAA